METRERQMKDSRHEASKLRDTTEKISVSSQRNKEMGTDQSLSKPILISADINLD